MANVGALHLYAEIGEEVEVCGGRPLGLVRVAGRFEDAHLLFVTTFVRQGLFVERFPWGGKRSDNKELSRAAV